MDKLDAIHNAKILESLGDISITIDGKYGYAQINELISYYRDKVAKYNNATISAINKTPTELGMFRKNVSMILGARINNIDMSGVIFSEELIDAYILLQRRYPWHKRNQLGVQLKETLSLMMVDEYYKCKNAL
jgi:hypothetical protein